MGAKRANHEEFFSSTGIVADMAGELSSIRQFRQ